MKQYLDLHQTAKLIELGFEKPKNERWVLDIANESSPSLENVVKRQAYSIGELIEMLHCLPMVIDISAECVVSSSLGRGYGIYTQGRELIDVLFEQIIKLKEGGVI